MLCLLETCLTMRLLFLRIFFFASSTRHLFYMINTNTGTIKIDDQLVRFLVCKFIYSYYMLYYFHGVVFRLYFLLY